jgi:hypothetical protein
MPEEVFILIMLMILSFFGLTFTSMILRHRRRGHERGKGTSDSSMTTSELERLMRSAVEDATIPLVSKIEDLELEIARLGNAPAQLQAHDSTKRIEFNEEEEILDVAPVGRQEKTSS